MVVLCGLPRVGKTTYGQEVAKRLGYQFVELLKVGFAGGTWIRSNRLFNQGIRSIL